MLWTKQFFYYNIEQWLAGDPTMTLPPDGRRTGCNHEWEHLDYFDIISMPDKWEYPYSFYVNGQAHTINYQPAESESDLSLQASPSATTRQVALSFLFK